MDWLPAFAQSHSSNSVSISTQLSPSLSLCFLFSFFCYSFSPSSCLFFSCFLSSLQAQGWEESLAFSSWYCTNGEGNGTPLQYCCPENPVDGGAWWAAVHGVAKSQTRLRDFTFTFHFHALEKEMATHSSVLAWRIPWTEKPGRLKSMGSHRVGQD